METTMQRTLFALAIGMLFSAGALAQNAASETQRDTNQQNRIEQGLKSGQLTTKEAGTLERDEQRIDRTQAHDMKNGPLTAQEKAQIQHEQNQASRQIYQDKHNAVTGNPDSKSSQRMQDDVQRNANQQARINQGIRSGQLSNHEAGSLERGQAHVDRSEANAARNGNVSAREQARTQGKENRQSGRVYRKKHDDTTRGG
jgi:hypothetical protein